MRHHPCTIGLLVAALSIAACGTDRPEPDTASDDPSGGAADDGAPQYEGSFTVLESPDHGPQLCAAVAQSYPPQCGGPDIEGWDWDTVDGEETAGDDTSWGQYHVTGTFAGGRFTLTEPAGPPHSAGTPPPVLDFNPACDDPEVVDPAQGIVQWGTVDVTGPDLVTTWVSDPTSAWDGPFVGSVVVLPGAGAATRDRIRQTYGGALCVVERDGPTADELARIQLELLDADAVAHMGQTSTTSPNGRLGAVVATIWLADGPALDYAQQRWGDLVRLVGLLQRVS